jgi:hypothetical protein
MLDRACAAAVLALVDAAKVHAPGHELAWLVGWAMRAANEPARAMVEIGGFERPDPRREPSEPPAPGPAHAAALARVPLGKRPT